MGNSHEFHNMSLFLWQWGVNCAVLPYQFNNTIKAIFHELQMTGNNLNQIAYLANCGYFHEAADKIPAFQKRYYSVMESLQAFIEKPIVDMYVVEAGEWHSET